MDNQERQAAMATRHRMKTNKIENTMHKTEKMSNTDLINKLGSEKIFDL